jgi:hypothetical protein
LIRVIVEFAFSGENVISPNDYLDWTMELCGGRSPRVTLSGGVLEEESHKLGAAGLKIATRCAVFLKTKVFRHFWY